MLNVRGNKLLIKKEKHTYISREEGMKKFKCKECVHFDEVLSGHTPPKVNNYMCHMWLKDVAKKDEVCKYFIENRRPA